MTQKPGYIAIEGCIGVGKTTLCAALSEHFGATQVLEEVETNPFLDEFYSNQESNAFKTQIFFLLSRFNQQKKMLQRDLFKSNIVSDYVIQKDKLFADINLNTSEMTLYNQLYSVLCEQIQKPDVLIYLRAPLNTILERIEKRGRDFEKNIKPGYLKRLCDSYDEFFKNYTDAPILQIETDRFNFPKSEQDVNVITDFVYKTFASGKSTKLGMLSDKNQPTLF